MTNNSIQLDHIALHVTDLDRSIRFYQDILHMQVFGPINLGTLSTSGRLIGKAVSEGKGLLKGIIGSLSSRAVRNQYTDIALLSTSRSGYDLLLVQERYPETNTIKSVDGKTIFGFSGTLSPSVDTEILGWDLHQAGVSFEWGNPGLDGTIYTSDCPIHSIYVKDPDGRMIELRPGTDETIPGSFLTGLDSITLQVTYPDKSRMFYCDQFGLVVDSDSGSKITGKRFIWLKNNSGERCILLYGQTLPDGNPVQAGGYGLDHVALTNCPCKGEKNVAVTDIRMDSDNLTENAGSSYVHDTDGYWIECCNK